MTVHSAGILVYRYKNNDLQVLLVHPGGPFWSGKDLGAWSIPKGIFDESEKPLDAAKREFKEETGFVVEGEFIELGELRQPSKKIIHVWSIEGNFELSQLKSNTFKMEWPRNSGKIQEYPEVDPRRMVFSRYRSEKNLQRTKRIFSSISQSTTILNLAHSGMATVINITQIIGSFTLDLVVIFGIYINTDFSSSTHQNGFFAVHN